MIKAEQPIEEVNALLFDDESQEFNSKDHNSDTQQQKTEPRLLKHKEFSSELETLEAVPYYKRPALQALVLLVFAVPVGWTLISAFSGGESPKPQLQANRPQDEQNRIFRESLDQERKKNQDLSIKNGLKTQQLEVIPVTVKPSAQPTPRTAVVRSQASSVTRRVSTPSTVPRPVSHTPSRPLAPVIPRASTPTKVEPKPDPMEQWLQAANAGSLGSGSLNSDATQTTNLQIDDSQADSQSTANSDEMQPSGGVGVPSAQFHLPVQTTAQINNSQDTAPISTQIQPSLGGTLQPQLQSATKAQTFQPIEYSSDPSTMLMVGTRASGEIDTAIGWSGDSSQNASLPNLRIKLLKALKTVDGKEVIPAGSYLVAKVDAVDSAGLLQLSAVSVQAGGNELPLPEGAIRIFGKKGRSLQAKYHGPKSRSFLSQVGNVASIAGAVTEDSNLSNLYVLNALQRNRQNSSTQPTYFTLDQGTSVQAYVDKSFSF